MEGKDRVPGGSEEGRVRRGTEHSLAPGVASGYLGHRVCCISHTAGCHPQPSPLGCSGDRPGCRIPRPWTGSCLRRCRPWVQRPWPFTPHREQCHRAHRIRQYQPRPKCPYRASVPFTFIYASRQPYVTGSWTSIWPRGNQSIFMEITQGHCAFQRRSQKLNTVCLCILNSDLSCSGSD